MSETEYFYRFTAGSVGIYAAVEKDCARNDERRKNKPDGSWLPKRGPDHPGAISFWKEFGLKQYIETGLLQWHAAVVKDKVAVQIIKRPTIVLYEDEYQIICNPDEAAIIKEEPLAEFLKNRTVPRQSIDDK